MSPHPKRKFSKGRTRRKRNSHFKVSTLKTVTCRHCRADKVPHRVCQSCGKS